MSEEWEASDPGGSDKAFQNKSDFSTISVNSVCGQYQVQSLDELSQNSLAGVGKDSIESTRNFTISNSPAKETIVNGNMDGSRYKMAFVVIKTGRCVYDLSYVASPDAYPRHEPEFRAIVESFKEGRPL